MNAFIHVCVYPHTKTILISLVAAFPNRPKYVVAVCGKRFSGKDYFALRLAEYIAV